MSEPLIQLIKWFYMMLTNGILIIHQPNQLNQKNQVQSVVQTKQQMSELLIQLIKSFYYDFDWLIKRFLL